MLGTEGSILLTVSVGIRTVAGRIRTALTSVGKGAAILPGIAQAALVLALAPVLGAGCGSSGPAAPVTFAQEDAGPGLAFEGKVVGVADGDTITVLRDREQIRVRLYGVDAPESGDAFGKVSKRFTSDLVFGRTVRVEAVDRDRYGRTVAKVFLPDGRSLGDELVRNGYAWWFRQYAATDRELERLEAGARRERKGLWADPNPIPPWESRAARRNAAGPTETGEPRGVADAELPPVIGNRRSKVYHRRDCPDYSWVSPSNRVSFSTPAEAEAAGYRKAGNCP